LLKASNKERKDSRELEPPKTPKGQVTPSKAGAKTPRTPHTTNVTREYRRLIDTIIQDMDEELTSVANDLTSKYPDKFAPLTRFKNLKEKLGGRAQALAAERIAYGCSIFGAKRDLLAGVPVHAESIRKSFRFVRLTLTTLLDLF